jgi:hypothetical protein
MAKEDNLKPAWEKGQSGNPKGKPKGSRNRSTIAREWLEMAEKFHNPISQKDEVLEQQDIITLALINRAKDGDVSAYKELMDSAYGKAIQKNETDLTVSGRKELDEETKKRIEDELRGEL